MQIQVLLLLTVVSAGLVSASFPPLDIGVLAWFGLSPFLFALRQRGLPAAAGLGFLFACIFVTCTFYWVLVISGINISNFLIWLFLLSLYLLTFGILYSLISRKAGAWMIIAAPALWIAVEYLRSNLFFLSWPWNLLGHSQHNYLPVIQIADITGVYGISFLIVMVNQFLSQLPDFIAMRKGIRSGNYNSSAYTAKLLSQLLPVAVLVIFTFCYGWSKLTLSENNGQIRVAVIQANVLAKSNMPYDDQVNHLKTYKKLTLEAAREKLDLIVWPASSLPAPIKSSRLVSFTVRHLARETGAYLLVGGAGHEKLAPRKEGHQPYSNSEFLVSPTGRIEGQYNKTRLLPFNEYLPLQGRFTWPSWITTLEESFLPGEEYTVFQANGIKFSAPICWENMFPDLFRHFVKNGAQFMVSVTNEGFFGNSPAPYQTLAINVFRAVENRVSVARASSTGISGFIMPDGNIIEKVSDGNGEHLFVPGFIVRDIPLSTKKSLYSIYGDVFVYLAAGILALIIFISLFMHKENVSD